MQKRNALIVFFSLAAALRLFGAGSFTLAGGGGQVSAYTLENGLSVFIREDSSLAVVTMELAVRAGYSSQSAANAGFAPLYVRLVKALFPGEVSASCNADSATYAVTVAPSAARSALAALAESICAEADDRLITETYDALRAEMEAYGGTATALINSAIDSRVFSAEPWKQDSGVPPKAFGGHSPESVRTFIKAMRGTLYVPQNAAIFITGPLRAEEVLPSVKETLGQWKGGAPGKAVPQGSPLPEETGRKFVIADDAFSPGLSQIVVQFVTLTAAQADTLSSAFNSITSPYIRLLMEEPALSLRSSDYAAASSTERGGKPRLILQALMEEPYSFSPPADGASRMADAAHQADTFVKKAKEAAFLTRKELVAAVSDVQASYRSSMGNSVTAMGILCDFWATDPGFGTGGFYGRFLDRAEASFRLSEPELSEAVEAEEPFVFLMVSAEDYARQKASFDEGGWTLVTRENAAWYDDGARLSLALGGRDEADDGEDAARTYFADEEISEAQRFYAANASRLSTATLRNGIPVTVKETPGTQTAALSLAIQGGELASPKDGKFLRTTLVNAFAANIQAEVNKLRLEGKFTGRTEIKAWTEETVSYITLQFQKEDLGSALSAASNAVIFGELSPVTADNLVYEQKGQQGTRLQSPAYQLRTNALKGLYRGTAFEELFGTDAPVLQGTAFNSIALEYTKLLDAALYTVVIAGDIDPGTALEAAQATFGTLREQTQRKPYAQVPEPSFTSGVQYIQLSHTFTTTMSADLAPLSAPLLIPTTEFSDPVAAFFPAPELSSERQVLNALLHEMARRMQEKLPAGTSCTATGATHQVRAASVCVDAILRTSLFDEAYRTARRELLSELSAPEKTEELTRSILSHWIVKELGATQTNEGTASLVQEGILSGNPAQYIDDFLFLETLSAQDLLFYAEQLLAEEPFTAYSKDSKK